MFFVLAIAQECEVGLAVKSQLSQNAFVETLDFVILWDIESICVVLEASYIHCDG